MGLTRLASAAKGGDVPAVRRLLAAEPASATGVDAVGWTPLHYAAHFGHAAAAAALLAAAPEAALINTEAGGTALRCAMESCLETVEDGIRHSVVGCHMPILRLLLQAAPAAATARDGQGATPLHLAATTGNVAAVELLLAAAPQAASLADSEGQTPLHRAVCVGSWARQYGSCSSVATQLLMLHGLLRAAPGAAMAANSSGDTPLHVAARALRAARALHCLHTPDMRKVRLLAVHLLMEAVPAAASVRDAAGMLPAQTVCPDYIIALHEPEAAARHLLQLAELAAAAAAPPTPARVGCRQLLRVLARLPHRLTITTITTAADAATETAIRTTVAVTGPSGHFADVAARLALTADEWQLVPANDPCLARALPAVLARSEA